MLWSHKKAESSPDSPDLRPTRTSRTRPLGDCKVSSSGALQMKTMGLHVTELHERWSRSIPVVQNRSGTEWQSSRRLSQASTEQELNPPACS